MEKYSYNTYMKTLDYRYKNDMKMKKNEVGKNEKGYKVFYLNYEWMNSTIQYHYKKNLKIICYLNSQI